MKIAGAAEETIFYCFKISGYYFVNYNTFAKLKKQTKMQIGEGIKLIR